LEKSDAAGGFEQIIDFLSESYINHALTVNPCVYISCIKQFWNTAVVKRSGDVTRLQALVDKKRIVIAEEVVREILQLNNAEGVICLPNDEIFAGLARMRYEKPSTKLTFYKAFFLTQWKFFIHTILHSLSAKRTSWNEFSSAMASALICLSSGQRFNFSKYIFESLVCNVDSSSKFYMYPRFIQLIIQTNIANLSKHTNRYISPVLTQKVFTNMRRVGKGFSGVETPLFETMLAVRDIAKRQRLRVKGLENANAAQQLAIVKLKARVKKLEKLNKVKSSKLRRLKKGRNIVDMDEGIKLVVDQEKDAEVQEAVEVVTTAKLITKVITAAATQVVAASTPIPAAKPKTLTITAAPAVSTRRRKGVKDQVEMDAEYAKKLQEELDKEHEESYKNIDWDAVLDHVQSKEPQYITRYHGIKKKPQSESEAHKNMISYLKNTEEMEKDDEEIIKSINETPAQKAAKRKKLSEEAQEADDLKKRLEIVQDEDDDVFVEASPLAQKVPVVDYQVVVIDNKPKEDLESLWRIVKDRFSTSKPTNFLDEYLLLTLKTMFGELDEQDAIWRNQKSVYGLALVKR
nr:hypothetical protein [Tanacetum cinerariifolium]